MKQQLSAFGFQVGVWLLLATVPAYGQIQPSSNPTPETQQTEQPQSPPTPTPANGLDLSPEMMENSPVLRRWQKKVPNVWRDIRNDPSFRTRVRLGYSQLLSDDDDKSGVNVGVQDLFLGRTGLTLSGEFMTSFNGDRMNYGGDLRYYVLPLGGYINFAPVVGYRHLETDDYSRGGVNVGARLLFVLSRTGAADIAVTQSWVSPGSSEEIGLTTVTLGYAVTQNLRLSTEFQQQNARERKDRQLGIFLEWMP